MSAGILEWTDRASRSAANSANTHAPDPLMRASPNRPSHSRCAATSGFGRNDLEPVVCRRHPEVAAHLEWLGRFGDARMSGSGACVFAEFAAEREARSVHSKMPADMRGLVVRGLDRQPLAALLENE